MKKHILLILISVGLIVFSLKETLAMHDMTFEDAYDLATRQRHPEELAEVKHLISKSNEWLGTDSHREDWFLGEGTNFVRLQSIDLTCQNIDDDFIKKLSASGFERITSINLTGNPKITKQSLQAILDSNSLGSMRELLQTSGRYGRPSSEVEIRVGGTSITQENADFFNKNPRFDFKIHYKRAADNVQLSPSVDESIKWLKILDATREGLSNPSWVPTGPTAPAYYVVGPQGTNPYPWPPTGPTGPVYYVGPQQGNNPYPSWSPTGPTGHAYYVGPQSPNPPYLWSPTGPAYMGPQGTNLNK